jgi:hypothetical protein
MLGGAAPPVRSRPPGQLAADPRSAAETNTCEVIGRRIRSLAQEP